MKNLLLTMLVISAFGITLQAAKNKNQVSVKPVNNELYKKECASCHFAYQPGLLPEKSWVFMMKNLQNHYGTDASIDEADNLTITKYLTQNCAENSQEYKRSAKITRSLKSGVLYTSLTEIPYLIEKHEDIDKKLIIQKEVKSLARCAACHTKADEGIYSDKTVEIPNYGRWEKKDAR